MGMTGIEKDDVVAEDELVLDSVIVATQNISRKTKHQYCLLKVSVGTVGVIVDPLVMVTSTIAIYILVSFKKETKSKYQHR